MSVLGVILVRIFRIRTRTTLNTENFHAVQGSQKTDILGYFVQCTYLALTTQLRCKPKDKQIPGFHPRILLWLNEMARDMVGFFGKKFNSPL